MKKKRFTEEQVVSILREGAAGGQTIGEVCRKHGISEPTFYVWRRKFGSMPESDVRRLKGLEKEAARLKRLLAERDVEIDVMRELLQKK
jgi:putative transposase